MRPMFLSPRGALPPRVFYYLSCGSLPKLVLEIHNGYSDGVLTHPPVVSLECHVFRSLEPVLFLSFSL